MLKDFIQKNKKKISVIATTSVIALAGITFIILNAIKPVQPAPISDETLASALSSLDVMETINFVEDKTVFMNPEKGFYQSFHSENMTNNDLLALKAKNMNMVMIETNLATGARGDYSITDSNIKNNPLTDAKLKEISDAFALVRSNGLKAIFRAAYTYRAVYGPEPADKNVMLNHIAQLKPIFAANEDVLYTVQAGLLGAWGEWHSTIYGDKDTGNGVDYKYNDIPLNIQKEVVAALLDAVPKSRTIQVREPRYIRAVNDGVKITDSIAFNQSNLSRIGFHNDCIMTSTNDYGTYNLEEVVSGKVEYTTREQELIWGESQMKYVPYGGETCESSHVAEYQALAAPANAVKEFRQLHAQYINNEYWLGIVNDIWRNTTYEGENTYSYISRNLGYKFILNNAQISSKVYAGGALHIVLNVKNDGFGGLMNDRNLEVVLSDGTSTYKAKVNEDMRKWYRENGSMSKDLYFSIPSNIKLGSWNLYLNLPDKAESLKDNPKYSIRLANTGVWNATTGYNSIKSGIVIESAGLASNNNGFTQITRAETETIMNIATTVPVSSITIAPIDTKLEIGATANVLATISPTNATIKTVTYSSSNTSIATVDSTGKISAVSQGEAIVTATSISGGLSATSKVTVNAPVVTVIPVTSITLSPKAMTIVKGQSQLLTSTILPTNATNKVVSYTSSNTSIAKVDTSGRVTAVSAGTANITATVIGEGKTAVSVVTVTQPVDSISISPTSLSIVKGSTGNVVGTISPSYATNKAMNYSSSNQSIATVDSTGKVTAIEVGTADITVTSVDGGKTAKSTITVTAIPVVVTPTPTPNPITVASWNDVPALVTLTTGYVKTMKIYNNQTHLYALINGTGLDTKNQFYIDTDNNTNTGYKTKWTASGIDYLVEKGNLYRYTGSNNSWSWTGIDTWSNPSNKITISKSDTALGMKIPLSVLGLSSGKTIHIGFMAGDSNSKIIPLRTSPLAAYVVGNGTSTLSF